MKSFYDLPDINEVKILVTIGLDVNNISDMGMCVILNDVELYDGGESVLLNTEIGVNDVFDLVIRVKNMHGGENSVHIDDISADGFNIMPSFNYMAEYSNNHGINSPTNIIEFDGEWHINTKIPLLHWIHNVKGNGWLLYP